MTENKNLVDLEQLFDHATRHHGSGELKEACRIYNDILRHIPDSPLVNYNYGLALYESGQFEESHESYKRALQQAPDNTDILYNLALCTKKLGKTDEAIRLYRKIIEISPDDWESLYNLGCALKDTHDDVKAIGVFLKVLKILPDHQSSLNNLAYLYHKIGEEKKALAMYSRLLLLNPEHSAAKHMVASLQGKAPYSAPLEYVENVFDDFAGHYEESLVKNLEYNVPALLRKHFSEVCTVEPHSLDILDLGCGTGLAGEVFKDLGSSLSGVDISQKMIEMAGNKKIYTALAVEGIEEYLQHSSSLFDLFIAADVFTYFGDLRPVFTHIGKGAKQKAYLCLSVEKNDGSTAFSLQKTGRFAHSREYVNDLAKRTDWKIMRQVEANIRKEKDSWIEGLLFILKKS